MSDFLLRFEGVTLRRGGRLLFDNLDFALGAGDGAHLTGPNGIGKSSLIRLAAGLLRADGGTVTRSRLALADDSLALDRELPLRRALQFWGAPPGRVHSALDRLGLAHLSDVPVRLLSAGQAKRAMLARVVASGVVLWLLDEPFNGLDSEGVDRLGTLLSEHRAEGGAVLTASHLPPPGQWTRMELGR